MSFTKPNKTKKSTANDVVMTKEETAKLIIDYFSNQYKETDSFLDPCSGLGAFYKNFNTENKYLCEIMLNIDFFDFNKPVDWIITNPPFSIFDDFLLHSFKISNNVIFFCPLNKVFKSKKIDQAIKKYGGIKEIVHLGTGGQHGFPFGFPVGCIHYQKDYIGDIKYTRLYNIN